VTRSRWARPALVISSCGLLLALWALSSHSLDELVLPSPGEVWSAFRDDLDRGAWWEAVSATLGHVLTAFGVVLALGIPIGVAMGRLAVVEDLLRVPVILLQTAPTVVLAAIALIALGTGDTGVVAVTVASSLPFFIVGIVQGTREVDPGLVQMARAYGAGEAAVVRSVVLPSLIPYVLAGSRIALGVGWHVTILGEYLFGTPAVGSQIASDIRLLDQASVFSWGLTIVAVTVLLEYGAFRPAERALRRWTR
jgi:NitT/TauT family transport system permease protein